MWVTHHVEVQSVDTDAGVVLDAQINVLLDAEAKVSGIGEVVLSQLVLTHLKEKGVRSLYESNVNMVSMKAFVDLPQLHQSNKRYKLIPVVFFNLQFF